MKNSTIFLVLIAVAGWFIIYKPSQPQPPDLSGPRFLLTGQVQRRLSEGVLLTCQREALPVAGALPSSNNQNADFARVLLRAHPGESGLVDGEKVNVQVVDNGVFQQNGETLRAYWYVGLPQPTPIVIQQPVWHNPLNDPIRRVGRSH